MAELSILAVENVKTLDYYQRDLQKYCKQVAKDMGQPQEETWAEFQRSFESPGSTMLLFLKEDLTCAGYALMTPMQQDLIQLHQLGAKPSEAKNVMETFYGYLDRHNIERVALTLPSEKVDATKKKFGPWPFETKWVTMQASLNGHNPYIKEEEGGEE